MSMSIRKITLNVLAVSGALGGISLALVAFAGSGYSGPFGVGSPMTADDEVKFEGLTVMPDGSGLPPGSGTYEEGRVVYMQKCVACHGAKMEGNPEMGSASWFALRGGRGTLASGEAFTTVESFWPYATTIFDYVYRAMPLNAPGSLSHDEVYAVTAYMLGEMEIIDKSQSMNAETLPKVEMPNLDGFIPDNRPDVYIYR